MRSETRLEKDTFFNNLLSILGAILEQKSVKNHPQNASEKTDGKTAKKTKK